MKRSSQEKLTNLKYENDAYVITPKNIKDMVTTYTWNIVFDTIYLNVYGNVRNNVRNNLKTISKNQLNNAYNIMESL